MSPDDIEPLADLDDLSYELAQWSDAADKVRERGEDFACFAALISEAYQALEKAVNVKREIE